METSLGDGRRSVSIVLFFNNELLINIIFQRKKLLNSVRPECVDLWLRRQRNIHFSPKIASVASIADEWWSWWRSLQPKWRKRSNSAYFSRDGTGNVSSIRIGGQSGLFEVVMVLAWWGDAMKALSDNSQQAAWGEAVTDVDWILTRS